MSVNIKEIIAKVKSSKEYIEYVKYHENNIFSITKVSRWELMHSNFLAWMLDPSESHGLNFYPIIQFMQMLCNMKLRRYPDTHTSDIFCDSNNIQKVDIIREYPVPVTDKSGKNKIKKIDLLIKIAYNDGVLPIVIENKVGSHENGEDKDQTEVYYNWCESNLKYAFKPLYLCFVPLFNKLDTKCEEFKLIDYQQLVCNIIEPCLWRTNNSWTHDTINTYLQCLSYQTDNEKGHNTMAISTEERKILTDFLENNDTFINSLLDIYYDDASEEEKKKIDDFRKIAKDYTSFEFDGKQYNKSHLASALIKKAIDDGKLSDYATLENKFKKIGKKNNIIRKVVDMPDKKRYDSFPEYSCFKLSGNEFGVSNQWDKSTIEDFIKVASSEFGYSIVTK